MPSLFRKPHYALIMGLICGTGISASLIDWRFCPIPQPSYVPDPSFVRPVMPETGNNYVLPTHYATGLYTAH